MPEKGGEIYMAELKANKTLEIWGFARQHLMASSSRGIGVSTRVNKAPVRPFITVWGEGSWSWGADGNERGAHGR